MNELDAWHVLIPQNVEKTLWKALITVHGQEHHLHMELPPDRNIQNASVWGDWKLERQLCKCRAMLENRLKSATDPAAFVLELRSILESCGGDGGGRGGGGGGKSAWLEMAEDSALYSRVVGELEQVGWERVGNIEPDFRRLELQCLDTSGTSHTIKLQLSHQYPTVPPVCSANLPDAFQVQWNSKCTLSDVLRQFEACLEDYHPFWTEMAEIDANTWILDPEKPGPADVSRRIALGNNSSIQVIVNPHHPRMLPQCRFLGADHVINPLRQHLNDNVQSWDSTASLLANLRAVLEVDFPSPAVSQQQDFTEECGICYSYRLDDVIPDQVCDNHHCNKPFHQTCLYEWLRALPSAHQAMAGLGFNTLYGECPYCSVPISMKKLDKR